jgi:L,D-transpeptidase ErfK/SrfK
MMAIFKNKIFLISSIIAGTILILFMVTEGIGYYILSQKKASWLKINSSATVLEDKELKALEKKNENIVKKIKKLAPKGVYIIVDTAKNTLYLKKDNEIIRKAVISTGSGNVLTEQGGKNRSWTFDTPRGEFAVKYKLKDPRWVKPDWAFIEEGEEIPKKVGDRVEEDVLGEYAMGFGNGYFLHGTLYTRLLGRNATHGCVRLGDEDLEVVNKAVTVGTKIFIF